MPTFRTTALAVGFVYTIYALVAASAVISLSAEPSARWPVDLALVSTISTTALHFFFILLGFTGGMYEPYPVRPLWAFLFADYVTAAALGISAVTLVLDSGTALPLDTLRAVAFTTTLATGVTQLLCLSKAYTLVDDVYTGRRDRDTGAWVARYVSGPY